MTRYWRDEAACSTATAGLFDPPAQEDNARKRINQAIKVCASCPVQGECITDAVRNSDSGVRAGQLLVHGAPTPLPHDTPKARPSGPSWRVERLHRLEEILRLHKAGVRPKDIAVAVGVSRQSVDNDLRRYVRDAA